MESSKQILETKLRLLYDLSAALGSVTDLDALLCQVVDAAAHVLNSEAASLLLLDDARRDLVFEVATGASGPQLTKAHLSLDEPSIAAWCVQHVEPVRVTDVKSDIRWARRFDEITSFTTRTILCVPLIVHGAAIGAIEILNKRTGEPFDDADERLMVAMAGPIATTIENARLYRALADAYRDTMQSLATAIEEKDTYTAAHVLRVSTFSMGVARALGLAGPELDSVHYGSILHDVGKIGVDTRVLCKPGPLTPDEWAEIRRHVEIGVQLVPRATFLAGARLCVRHHHERFDGGGYPDGLRGENIPLSARIVSVADGFDAMTSDRSYRRRMTMDQALDLLRAGSGMQWDPAVVDCFLAVHDELQA